MNGASDLCNEAIRMFGSTGNIVEKNKGPFIEMLGRPIVILLSLKVISFFNSVFFLEAISIKK